MPKQKITNTFLKRVPIPKDKSKVLYSDTMTKGLILEVRSNGTKTFYYRYYKKSKTHYKKIGRYPDMDINSSRRTIENIIVSSSNTELFNSQDSSSNAITLQEFYENYYLPFIQTSKKSYKQDISYYRNHILPIWGTTSMNKITQVDITTKHISLVKENKLSFSTANKLIKYISYTYNLALSWNIPHITCNPTKYIKLFAEDNIVEKYLTKEEIKTILHIASKNENPLILHILQFLILTGARKNEVLQAKWEDIDLINNIFTIPLSKSGKVRRIPISPKLQSIIQSIPKYDSPYLFPSFKTKLPMKKFEYHWYKIRKEANLDNVRLHDLRHTFASTLVNAGVSLYEVQKLLGHSNISITQRYAHLSNNSLFNAVCVVQNVIN